MSQAKSLPKESRGGTGELRSGGEPPFVLSSRIESVTVFSRGAEIVRVAELPAGPLPARVRWANLPLIAEDGSFQAQVEGNAAITGTDLRIGVDIGLPDLELPPPDDEELEAARRAELRARREVEQLKRDLEALDALRLAPRPEGAKGTPPAEMPTEARWALIQWRRERRESLLEAQLAAEATWDERRRTLEALQERWAQASSARQARPHELRKTAILRLESSSEGAAGEGRTGFAQSGGFEDGQAGDGESSDLRLSLRYLVAGAAWAPSYVLRLQESLDACELEVRALVRQFTGEDWSGVRLRLSTAHPQRWNELPKLEALRIGRAQRSPAAWRAPPGGTAALFNDYQRAAKKLSSPPTVTQAGQYLTRDFDSSELPDELDPTIDGLMLSEAPVAGGGMPPRGAMELAADEEHTGEMSALPAPMAPPAPMISRASAEAMIQPQSLPTRSAGLLSSFGNAPSAPKAKKRRRAARGPGLDIGANTGGAMDIEMQGEPDPRLMSFGQLIMPPPSSGQRGRLVLRTSTELMMDWLDEQGVVVDFSVEAQIELERTAAERFIASPPSRGHRFIDEDRNFAYIFSGDHTVSLPSDGEDHSVSITRRTAQPQIRHVSVPREQQSVFRMLRMPNPLEAPLLAGPVDVYVGEDFLMTSDLEETPASSTMELGIGVEQAVRVARNVRYEERTTGLIRGSVELEHRIRIEVASELDRAIELEVRERVPVPHNDEGDIRVSVEAVEPPWKAYAPPERPLAGGKAWRVDLAPRGSSVLEAQYVIRLPSGQELVGGNRREDG